MKACEEKSAQLMTTANRVASFCVPAMGFGGHRTSNGTVTRLQTHEQPETTADFLNGQSPDYQRMLRAFGGTVASPC
jgi:hypothetical protein